jgi:hypothetical protein
VTPDGEASWRIARLFLKPSVLILAILLPVTPNFSPRAKRADSDEKMGFIICLDLPIK